MSTSVPVRSQATAGDRLLRVCPETTDSRLSLLRSCPPVRLVLRTVALVICPCRRRREEPERRLPLMSAIRTMEHGTGHHLTLVGRGITQELEIVRRIFVAMRAESETMLFFEELSLRCRSKRRSTYWLATNKATSCCKNASVTGWKENTARD